MKLRLTIIINCRQYNYYNWFYFKFKIRRSFWYY